MESRPSSSKVSEIKRDGRFIAYDNGTGLDTRTNLMWAARDNGNDINWTNTKFCCENYRGGGYTDWRMPTQDELEELYDRISFGCYKENECLIDGLNVHKEGCHGQGNDN